VLLTFISGETRKNVKRTFTIFVLVFLLASLSNYANAQTSDKVVILETQLGKIVIEFFSEDAPKTVENFLKLADSGFYDGIVFHRIIKDFMIQGGDPLTKQVENQGQWGTGNAGYNIQAEFNTIKHNRGIVSMARSADPNSASSQFYIVHKDSNFLDEQYTVFGRILTQESFDTLDKIASLSTGAKDVPLDIEQAKILKAEVVIRSEISDLLNLGSPERVLSPTESLTESPIERYTDEKLGISFIAPSGWIIQQPQKTAPEVPDIVITGPISEGFNPLISITIVDSDGKSLEQKMIETRESFQQVIDDGTLEIISEEKTTIDGKEAHVLHAVGVFESEIGAANLKFNEIKIATPDKFYTLAYINRVNNFEDHLENFETVKNSFVILSAGGEIYSDEVNQEGGGCLIATATFGSELAPQVQQLRELRDNSLLQTESGSAFMESFNQFYYSFSPTIADYERQNPVFKEIVKLGITPLLTSLSILNYVDMDSEFEVLGYGISLIILNVGMYFVAPAIVIHRIKKYV